MAVLNEKKGEKTRSKEELNEALWKRDENIYSEIMDRYGKVVIYKLRDLVSRQPKAIRKSIELDPEDILQDVLLRLLEKVDQLEFDRLSQVGTWLIIVAKRLCINKMKHLNVEDKYKIWWKEIEKTGVLQQSTATSAKWGAFHKLYLNLGEKEKVLIFSYYYEGLTHKEIASMFGKSRTWVQAKMHELRMTFQKKLGA